MRETLIESAIQNDQVVYFTVNFCEVHCEVVVQSFGDYILRLLLTIMFYFATRTFKGTIQMLKYYLNIRIFRLLMTDETLRGIPRQPIISDVDRGQQHCHIYFATFDDWYTQRVGY